MRLACVVLLRSVTQSVQQMHEIESSDHGHASGV